MRLALERLGVSQRAAAAAAGVTHAALNRALSGDSEPSADLVFKVAEAHGLSLEWLFREQGPMIVGGGAGEWAREIRLSVLREAQEAIGRLAEETDPAVLRARELEMVEDVTRLADEIFAPPPPAKGKKRA